MAVLKHQDEFIQFKGHTRVQHFQPTKLGNTPMKSLVPKTNAQNQYRGHGRGQ